MASIMTWSASRKRPMRGWLVSAMAALLLFANPVFALADCADYGATAAAQQRENIELGCGFSGLRWHVDEAGHAGFCRLTGEGTASGETAIREAELAKCRPEPEAEVLDEPTNCQRSEIAEGTGSSRRDAESAAHSELGRPRAEMMNSGLTRCLYHSLGCTKSDGVHTCFMSVGCCEKLN